MFRNNRAMREMWRNDQMFSNRFYVHHKPYGFFSFMGDIFMTFLTAGLWLIWIFVREMRGR